MCWLNGLASSFHPINRSPSIELKPCKYITCVLVLTRRTAENLQLDENKFQVTVTLGC